MLAQFIVRHCSLISLSDLVVAADDRFHVVSHIGIVPQWIMLQVNIHKDLFLHLRP